MGTPVTDMAGMRFGRLTVLRRAPLTRTTKAAWLCACDCGEQRVVIGQNLRYGKTESCGCRKREEQSARITARNTIHGHNTAQFQTPTWHSWRSMIKRCTNPRHVSYPSYGGRGIRVCDRWRDYPNFLADMGERPAGKTIDRIDVNGNYEPGNCRWATASEQQRNRRCSRAAA